MHCHREVQPPSVCQHSRWEGMRQSEPSLPPSNKAHTPQGTWTWSHCHPKLCDSTMLSPKILHTSSCVSMSHSLTALVNHQTWHSESGKEVQKVEVTEKKLSAISTASETEVVTGRSSQFHVLKDEKGGRVCPAAASAASSGCSGLSPDSHIHLCTTP